MKGMVIKDLLVLRSSLRTVVVIILVFGFMGAMNGNSFMATFASVYAAILPMTCMAYDERCSFNRFAMAMPVTHRDIVLSKYITGLILAAFAAVISVAMLLVSGDITAMDFAANMATALLIPLLYHTFLIPIMFRVGVEKSRMVIMVVMVMPAMLLMVASQHGILDGIIGALSEQSAAFLAAAATVAVVAAYIISVFISMAICRNKEW